MFTLQIYFNLVESRISFYRILVRRLSWIYLSFRLTLVNPPARHKSSWVCKFFGGSHEQLLNQNIREEIWDVSLRTLNVNAYNLN